ncbi:MAG: exo-alpha-sialidase [Clostridia bacterium]|nr:exo-alpha-sialidase [Clostridia bacterium]
MKVLGQYVVAQGSDRFYGWPANCGMWCWQTEESPKGEILVGFTEGYHLVDHGTHHAIDCDRPSALVFGRSYDGGETWTIERPQLNRVSKEAKAAMMESKPDDVVDEQWIPSLKEPLDFSAPGFAMMFHSLEVRYPSRSWFYYTYDKGHTWYGPYRMPTLRPAMSMRTDYTVLDSKTLYLGMTASRADGEEGVVLAGKLCDGGMRWEITGDIGEEPAEGFRIMPSTVLMPDGSIVCATRYCEEEDAGVKSVEIYRSTDNGANWEKTASLGDSCHPYAGNPPAMCLLDSGRLVVIYGKRDAPNGIIAHTSDDGGFNWSEPFYLRDDCDCKDMGYPKMVIRPDGMAVAAYYYTHTDAEPRFIGCTIFDPAD